MSSRFLNFGMVKPRPGMRASGTVSKNFQSTMPMNAPMKPPNELSPS